MTPAVNPVEQRPQFPVLDALRAVGAIAVLTTHVTFRSGEYLRDDVWGGVFARLDVGVALFFVLSGFLLGRPYLARATRGEAPAVGRYYWKRLLRIYPVYAVTVVVALVFVQQETPIGIGDWIRSFLLVNTYTDPLLPQGLTQMWSLAVEVAFYAILPLLMLVALGRRRSLRVSRVVAVLVSMLAISVVWHLGVGQAIEERTDGVAMIWLPAYLSWFAAGLALALAHVAFERSPGSRLEERMRTMARLPGTCWVAAGGLFLVCATPLVGPTFLFPPTDAESLLKNLLYGVIAALVILPGIFGDPDGRYARAMSLPPLRRLGLISYGIFCIHLPVADLIVVAGGFELFGGHGLLLWVLTLGLSIVAAEVLYRVIERPFMGLKDRRPPWRSRSAPTRGSTQAASTK